MSYRDFFPPPASGARTAKAQAKAILDSLDADTAPGGAERVKIRAGLESLMERMNVSPEDRKVLRDDLEMSFAAPRKARRKAPSIPEIVEIRVVHVLDLSQALEQVTDAMDDAGFGAMVDAIMSAVDEAPAFEGEE